MRSRTSSGIWAVFLLLVLSILGGCGSNHVRLRGVGDSQTLSSEDLSERKALIILPGVGITSSRKKAIIKWTETTQYDVFVSDFDTRVGFAGCLKELDEFIAKNRLREYETVNCFAYIMGGRLLTVYLRNNEFKNLDRIVYDRSPIQERAPKSSMINIPTIAKIAAGQIVADLAARDYETVPQGSRQIGLIIESKATRLMRWMKDTALSMGPLEWDPIDPYQEHVDHMYVFINHDELYTSFDKIGDELLHFFEHGKFTDKARRHKFDMDPFEK